MKKKIIVHSGRFHADEVCAAAILSLVFKGQIEVVRTRDEQAMIGADFVVDVGGVYDESKNMFDHHQQGGAGMRENNVPYASCGLVWKKYGVELCGSPEVAARIDKNIFQPIDLADNGVAGYTLLFEDVSPLLFQSVISSYYPTWKEKDHSIDEGFQKALVFATAFLKREIQIQQDVVEGEHFVKTAYETAPDKRIIVLDDNYNYHDIIAQYPEPLFVVYPNPGAISWHVSAVKVGDGTFQNRKDFPEAWAGKRDAELAAVTGVSDALFCHNKRFLAVAKTKEGAMKLAELALV